MGYSQQCDIFAELLPEGSLNDAVGRVIWGDTCQLFRITEAKEPYRPMAEVARAQTSA